MILNADLSVRVAVHAATREWTPSPMAGVERRMLDRVGGEVARATSIVRYAPGSKFSPHRHDGGEEFFVIDGVFEDEHGDYPAGTYCRNPPGTSHTPGSAVGCTMLVKLWQFELHDRTQVKIDAARAVPVACAHRPGVETIALFDDAREHVRLERWSPGQRIHIDADGGIEVLVLSGGFEEGGDAFVEMSWLRLPVGRKLTAVTGSAGCRVWIKEGHLRHVSDGPTA